MRSFRDVIIVACLLGLVVSAATTAAEAAPAAGISQAASSVRSAETSRPTGSFVEKALLHFTSHRHHYW